MAKTILAVDDQREYLEQYNGALGGEYSLITVNNPFKAVEIAGACSIDLLISDLEMPLGGDDVIRQVHKIRPDAKKLLVTSVEGESIKNILTVLNDINGIKTNYLHKPFDDGELAAKVRELIG